MNCLRLDQIYQFLENDLPDLEISAIQKHIAQCPRCHQAVANRQKLTQASESLPFLDVPSGFSHQIMSRIFPQTLPISRSLITAAAGAGVIFVTTLLIFIASGQNLVNVLMAMNQSVLNSLQDLSVFFAKFIKLALLFIKMIIQFAGYFVAGLTHMTTIIGPEFQIAFVFITLLISGTLFYGLKRKFFLGEKQ
jgi:hypothetical protein